MEQIKINRLPGQTWNKLKMNFTQADRKSAAASTGKNLQLLIKRIVLVYIGIVFIALRIVRQDGKTLLAGEGYQLFRNVRSAENNAIRVPRTIIGK